MGTTPHQYLLQCRIEKAKELLTNTTLNLDEITIQVGYKSAAHFSRLFSKAVKTTPIKYRQKNKNIVGTL